MPRWRDPRVRLGATLAVLLVVAAATTIPRVQRGLERDAVRRLAEALGDPAAGVAAELVLQRAGITGVDVSGHHVTIRGVPRPAAEVARLEAVVVGDGIASARYEFDPQARRIDGAGVGVDVTVRREGAALVLAGQVQSDAQRTTLLAAAEFAFGGGRVRSTLTVVTRGPRDAVVDEQISALAVLLTNAARASALDVRLAPDVLTVRATVPDAATQDLLGTLASALRGEPARPATIDVRVGGPAPVAVEPATTVR